MDSQSDFIVSKRGNKTALVHPEYADVVADALFEGTGCEDAPIGGRGSLQRFRYPGGAGLVRTYHRGGAMRLFLVRSYLFVNRPLRELEVHRKVHREGLAVPTPLGACWERHGITYRGSFATNELDGRDLLAHLSTSHDDPHETLFRLGALILQMHEMGVYHADLHLRNVLVVEGAPFLIDFDNARIRSSLGRTQRARNLLRLRRSFEKNGLSTERFEAVCEGYGIRHFSGWLSGTYRLKGMLSDLSRSSGTEHDG